ncbi:MAG: periplasmic heavy metal sensor [candidate division WOR-3 bacterium]|nr:periplasmic heavy metal sensor [candidate division WOR-3 bacterium]
MKEKIIIILLIISIGLNIGIIATLIVRDFRADNPPLMQPRDLSSLNLSDEQRVKVRRLKEDILDHNREAMDIMREKRAQLINEMQQDDIDSSRIRALIEDISAIQSDIETRTVLRLKQLKSIMNEEQFNLLIETLNPRRNHCKPLVPNRRTR